MGGRSPARARLTERGGQPTARTSRGRDRSRSCSKGRGKREKGGRSKRLRAVSTTEVRGVGQKGTKRRTREPSKPEEKGRRRSSSSVARGRQRPPSPSNSPTAKKMGTSDAELRGTVWENELSVRQQTGNDGEPMMRIDGGSYSFEQSKVEQDGRYIGILEVKYRDWPNQTRKSLIEAGMEDSTFGGRYLRLTKDVLKVLSSWTTHRELVSCYGKHIVLCKKCGGAGHGMGRCESNPGDNVGGVFDPNNVCGPQAAVLNRYHPELIAPWIQRKGGMSIAQKKEKGCLFLGEDVATPEEELPDFVSAESRLQVKTWHSDPGIKAPPTRVWKEEFPPSGWGGFQGGSGKSGYSSDQGAKSKASKDQSSAGSSKSGWTQKEWDTNTGQGGWGSSSSWSGSQKTDEWTTKVEVAVRVTGPEWGSDQLTIDDSTLKDTSKKDDDPEAEVEFRDDVFDTDEKLSEEELQARSQIYELDNYRDAELTKDETVVWTRVKKKAQTVRNKADQGRLNEVKRHNLGPLLPIILEKTPSDVSGEERYVDLGRIANKHKRFMMDFMTTYQEQGCEDLAISVKEIDQLQTLMSQWVGMASTWRFEAKDHSGRGMTLGGFTFRDEWSEERKRYECVCRVERRSAMEVRVEKTGDHQKDRARLLDMVQQKGRAMEDAFMANFTKVVERLPYVTGPNGKSVLIRGGETMNAQICDGSNLKELQAKAFEQLGLTFDDTGEEIQRFAEQQRAELRARDTLPDDNEQYAPTQVWLRSAPRIDHTVTPGVTDDALTKRLDFHAEQKNLILKFGCKGDGADFEAQFLGGLSFRFEEAGMDPADSNNQIRYMQSKLLPESFNGELSLAPHFRKYVKDTPAGALDFTKTGVPVYMADHVNQVTWPTGNQAKGKSNGHSPGASWWGNGGPVYSSQEVEQSLSSWQDQIGNRVRVGGKKITVVDVWRGTTEPGGDYVKEYGLQEWAKPELTKSEFVQYPWVVFVGLPCAADTPENRQKGFIPATKAIYEGDLKLYRRVVNEFVAVVGVAVGRKGPKDDERGANFTIMLTATGAVMSVFVPEGKGNSGPKFSSGLEGLPAIEGMIENPFDGLNLKTNQEFAAHWWSNKNWNLLYEVQKFSSTAGLIGYGKGPRWQTFDSTSPRIVPMSCRPREGRMEKMNYLLPRVSGGFIPLATLETQHIEAGNMGLLNIFLMGTIRTHKKIKLVVENPEAEDDGKTRACAMTVDISAIEKISCAMVHWNANLIGTRYAGNMRVIAQAGLPATADEYLASSSIPMPSYEHPMPFAGPYDPMTGQPSVPAVANALKENLRQTGVCWKEADPDQAIQSQMPGASIPLQGHSTLAAANENGWKTKKKNHNWVKELKMGFPDLEPSWVESELRYDGQDGQVWDQLIKDGVEGGKIDQQHFKGYDPGASVAEKTRVGNEDWAPCQPCGLSWWPVIHMQLDPTHANVRQAGPILKEVEVYACWYQIMCHEMWKGIDQFYIEAWTVQGQRLAQGGHLTPEQASRFRSGLNRLQQDVLRETPASGARFQDANQTQNG